VHACDVVLPFDRAPGALVGVLGPAFGPARRAFQPAGDGRLKRSGGVPTEGLRGNAERPECAKRKGRPRIAPRRRRETVSNIRQQIESAYRSRVILRGRVGCTPSKSVLCFLLGEEERIVQLGTSFAGGLLLRGSESCQRFSRSHGGRDQFGDRGALLGGGAVLLYFVAISHLPVGVATLLNNSSPLFVAVFSWVFLREPFSWRTLMALAVTSVGVVLVVLGNASSVGGPTLSLRWVFMGLGSAVFAGGAVTTMRAMRKREGAWEIFLALCVIGSVITGIPAAFEFVWPTRHDLFWVALTGFLSVGSQILLTYSLRYVPAVRAGLLMQLTPILTFILGALWLGEFPSMLGWLGSIVTIGGVCWGMWSRSTS